MLEPYTITGTPLRLHAAEGDPAGEIVRYPSELQADLIVMGTHGRGGFDRFTLGSVTEKVLRKAPCPVLTLPPGAASSAVAVDYRSIPCPTTADDDADTTDRKTPIGDHTRPRCEKEAEALHSRLATQVRPSDSVSELITTGKPHRAILRVANDCRADVIVIGVRGRGPVDLTLFGSTTNQVVRRAVCPMITVRSRGEES